MQWLHLRQGTGPKSEASKRTGTPDALCALLPPQRRHHLRRLSVFKRTGGACRSAAVSRVDLRRRYGRYERTELSSFVTSNEPGMPQPLTSLLTPVVLLILSNVFMTFAWYGHLKFTDRPLWVVVLASWGIAFVEYWLAVPANRWGVLVYTPAQLKTMQEVITLVVFAVFSVLYLKSAFTLNHMVGFALIALGAFFVFKGPL
jgi:uncharacterized protein (DUF486 family)